MAFVSSVDSDGRPPLAFGSSSYNSFFLYKIVPSDADGVNKERKGRKWELHYSNLQFLYRIKPLKGDLVSLFS